MEERGREGGGERGETTEIGGDWTSQEGGNHLKDSKITDLCKCRKFGMYLGRKYDVIMIIEICLQCLEYQIRQ